MYFIINDITELVRLLTGGDYSCIFSKLIHLLCTHTLHTSVIITIRKLAAKENVSYLETA